MELAEIGFEGEGVTHCQELGGGDVDVNLERDRDFLPTYIDFDNKLYNAM